MADAPLYELAGGEDKVRAVLQDFYDRVFDDVMIGFLFRNANKTRLIDKETELTLEALGAPGVRYTGKGIREAHAPHPIMGGHFQRRLQILKETLSDHDVPAPVREAWIRHSESLRPDITHDEDGTCTPPAG